jgi:regulator of sirC expression with transglutaminase-like and TPR domain
VAQRLNLPVYGVNLPVVFVLLYRSRGLECYINVFNQGSVFVRSDIEDYLKQLNVEPQVTFFEPCTHADILARACRNLIFSFKELGEIHKAEEVKQLLDIIEHYK